MKKLITIFILFFSPSLHSEILLFGGNNHDEFLGCLDCNRFDSDSICNKFGTYGSRFSSDSIFNRFGTYGSRFDSSSPWNRFSSSNSVPVAVDRQGTFYGYFTINRFRTDAINIAGQLNNIYENADGDLEIVQENLCSIF